jgi:serine/threonine-protein kinase
LVAALAVLLGALGATALRASPARTASLEPVAGPGSETRAAPGASASSTVELRLSASPAEARFFIDDAPLEGNPFQGELPRDHAVHRVRIAAPGFLPRVESVTLDQNTILDVELAAEPAHARSQPAHARPQPSASSSAGVPKAPRIVEW